MANGVSPLIYNSLTSADIIRDTKRELKYDGFRETTTKRPETPLESSRRFFRSNSSDNFKIKHNGNGVSNYDPDSRPNSSTIRLEPLEKTRPHSNTSEHRYPPRPPQIQPNKKQTAISKNNFQKDLMIIGSKTGSLSGSLSGSLQDAHRSTSIIDYNSITADHLRIQSGSNDRNRNQLTRSGTFDESRMSSHSDHETPPSFLPTIDKTKSNISESVPKKAPSQNPAHQRHGSPYRDKDGPDDSLNANKAIQKNMRSINVHPTVAPQSTKVNGVGRQQVEGNSQSRGARGKEDEYYSGCILPILNAFEKNGNASADEVKQLYCLLSKGNLLGHNCSNRKAILKVLYSLLMTEDPKTFISLIHIIFALKVTGKNLLIVCTLLSEFSMKKDNDVYFSDSLLIDDILEIVSVTDPSLSKEAYNAFFHALASVKFISSNSQILRLLATRANLLVLTNALIIMNLKIVEDKENYVKLFIQLAETLRNITVVTGMASEFSNINMLPELTKILTLVPNEFDVLFWLSRIFSKLITHQECCRKISSRDANVIQSFVASLHLFIAKEDLVLRLLYILGNIMSKIEESRTDFLKIQNSIKTIFDVFSYYHEKVLTVNKDTRLKSKKWVDILSKAMSLVASLALSEEAGTFLSSYENCLLALRSVLANCHADPDLYSDECMYTCLAALHNISFQDGPQSCLVGSLELVEDILPYLKSSNQLILSDVLSLIANLTHNKQIRTYLHKKNVVCSVVELLDSTDVEIVYACCGVLTNIMQDPTRRIELRQFDVVQKLISVLKDLGPLDWNLAVVATQTLWNYSIDSRKCFHQFYTQDEGQRLMDVLLEYLDEDTIRHYGDSDMKEYLLEIWKTDFKPVASELLTLLEGFISPLEILK